MTTTGGGCIKRNILQKRVSIHFTQLTNTQKKIDTKTLRFHRIVPRRRQLVARPLTPMRHH